MFNPVLTVIDAFVARLQEGYRATFSNLEPSYPGVIGWLGRMAMERLANSDALYHNVEHTVMVTLVGQEILRGKQLLRGGVTPHDWLNFILSLVCHDIGYLRGCCLEDTDDSFVADESGKRVTLPEGASDAYLAPYHVERSKIFVRERFGEVGLFDVERLTQGLELTRFPVPNDDDHRETESDAALVRAADLIGQLADPAYMRKINALFYEFEETGVNRRLGYKTPADLAEQYPRFYWGAVRPFITTGLTYLHATQEGKQWVANLHTHVFAAEHNERRLGPQRLSSYGPLGLSAHG